MPDDPWKQKWDIFIAFLVIYISVATPYRIAFVDIESWLDYVDYAIDFFFFIDWFVVSPDACVVVEFFDGPVASWAPEEAVEFIETSF